MTRGLRIAFSLLLFAGAAWHAPAAFAETDCEQAEVDYDRALQQRDPVQALALLDGVIARCPSRAMAWFVKGNAHRMLEQWDQALAAYEHAHGKAGKPELGFTAQAYGALMQQRLGRTCEAARTFQYLQAGYDRAMPSWLRDSYEAYERSLAESPMATEDMACALRMTEAHRTFGVCPYVNVRIPFAYDRADVDARNRPQVEQLAEALRRVHDDAQRYRLVGHTDSRGSADYNQSLSQRRAQSVQAFILGLQGDLRGRLEARGEGESRLLATDDTESSHALNRRVEMQVLCQGG